MATVRSRVRWSLRRDNLTFPTRLLKPSYTPTYMHIHCHYPMSQFFKKQKATWNMVLTCSSSSSRMLTNTSYSELICWVHGVMAA